MNYDEIAAQLIAQSQRSFQEAKAANERRYQEIIAGYDDIIGTIPGTYAEALRAGQMAIDRRTKQGLAQTDQNFVSRGLYNTTALDAARRSTLLGGQLESIQLAADYGAKQAQLEADVRGQKLLAMSNRQDLYMDPSLYAQIAFQLGRGTGSNSNFNGNYGGIGGGGFGGGSISVGGGSSGPYDALDDSVDDWMQDQWNKINQPAGGGSSGGSGGYGGSYVGGGSYSDSIPREPFVPTGYGYDPDPNDPNNRSYTVPNDDRPVDDPATSDAVPNYGIDQPINMPVDSAPTRAAPSGYKWTNDGRLILIGGVYDASYA